MKKALILSLCLWGSASAQEAQEPTTQERLLSLKNRFLDVTKKKVDQASEVTKTTIRKVDEWANDEGEKVPTDPEPVPQQHRYISSLEVKEHLRRQFHTEPRKLAANYHQVIRQNRYDLQMLNAGHYDDYCTTMALQYNVNAAVKNGDNTQAQLFQTQLTEHQTMVAQKQQAAEMQANLRRIASSLDGIDFSLRGINSTLNYGTIQVRPVD